MKKTLFVVIALISTTFLCPNQFSPSRRIGQSHYKTFNVPGIAVAIVKDGKVVLAEGYGVKSIVTKEKVDANTLLALPQTVKRCSSSDTC
jgi:CubicO group peptidase (beta-lactamase class C family)